MKTLTKSGHVTESRIRIPPQSARLFIQSSELGPHLLTRRLVCPPPLGWGGYTCLHERGWGGVPIWTTGQTLWYSRYMMYFVIGAVC
jgi:hypothetical protein